LQRIIPAVRAALSGAGGRGGRFLWWSDECVSPSLCVYEASANTDSRIALYQRFLKSQAQSHCTASEASWRRVFDPWNPLLFDLYHYLEQNGSFWLVPEHTPGPSIQVLSGCRVRHPLGSTKGFVRYGKFGNELIYENFYEDALHLPRSSSFFGCWWPCACSSSLRAARAIGVAICTHTHARTHTHTRAHIHAHTHTKTCLVAQ